MAVHHLRVLVGLVVSSWAFAHPASGLHPLDHPDTSCVLVDLSVTSLVRDAFLRCPVPAGDDASPINASAIFPWTHPKHCIEAKYGPDDRFCAFTAATSGPHGLSIVAEPRYAAHMAGFVSDAYHRRVPDPPYKVVELPGKGRGVVATRAIKRDEPILSDYAVLVLDSRVLVALDKEDSDALLGLATDRLAQPERVYEGARSHPEHDVVLDVIATNAFSLDVGNETFYRLFPEIAVRLIQAR